MTIAVARRQSQDGQTYFPVRLERGGLDLELCSPSPSLRVRSDRTRFTNPKSASSDLHTYLWSPGARARARSGAGAGVGVGVGVGFGG